MLKTILSNNLTSYKGEERFIKTNPGLLILHELPEFNTWADKFVEDTFLEVEG